MLEISTIPGTTPVSFSPTVTTYEEYELLVKTLCSVEKSIQWWVGDAAIYGEQQQPLWKQDYTQAWPVKYSEESMRVYRWVCERIPVEHRRPELSFRSHQILAGVKDAEYRYALINTAADLDLTSREVRKLLHPEDEMEGRVTQDSNVTQPLHNGVILKTDRALALIEFLARVSYVLPPEDREASAGFVQELEAAISADNACVTQQSDVTRITPLPIHPEISDYPPSLPPVSPLPLNTPQPPYIPPLEPPKLTKNNSEGESEGKGKSAKRFVPPTEAEAKDHGTALGLPLSQSIQFWTYWESREWTGKGGKIKNWKMAMRTWKEKWQEDKQAKQPKPTREYNVVTEADLEAATA